MRRSILLAALVSIAPSACASGSNGERAPQANVAESLAAERDFREVFRAWSTARADARGLLEPELRAFLERHPDDRRARVARVYLAWLLAQRGKLAEARMLVAQARQGAAGTARDFASVAEAAILLREGKPDEALSVLTPLEGKIIDPVERFMFGEQQVLSALAARRQTLAVQHMQEWLSQASPEDRDAVQGRVHELIQDLAPESLERAMATLHAEREAGPSSPEAQASRQWLLSVVCERLGRYALERADGDLARRLLDSGEPIFRRGTLGASLARIARAGSVAPQIAGRALGLVLSVQSSAGRLRSAQVVAGITAALGLPESASDPEAVQLVTGEDDGSADGMRRALAALAGEGAAILIAGVDPEGAKRAAEYADDASIPVLLLSNAKVAAGGFAFSLGEDSDGELAALEAGLASAGAKRPARVGTGGVPCDTAPKLSGLPRFPVDEWKRDQVDALIVLGGPSCARDAARESAAAGRRLLVGLGLESMEAFGALDAGQPHLAVGAGALPYSPSAKNPETLQRFVQRTGRAPSWHAALGHDAAALSRVVLDSFALEQVDDARAVAELHITGRQKLSDARAELWSTNARGFAGGRVLGRDFHAVPFVAGAKQGKKP